ncbi:hypothetical protein KVT40_002669 [Elsinoe batatas]|uniref:Uncharacterized protein n=1 Tax=Elsinoe batatas TaxID=2601811 RepID=A0A8K0L338_9PEZI|nr:hypothetical protein KVT40_002669 [Elsinoe batatas]
MPALKPTSRDDFQIAIFCALGLEAEAVLRALDRCWEDEGEQWGKAEDDLNSYSTGAIGHHNVVLVYLWSMGLLPSSSAAVSLQKSYPCIRLALVVGVCGGVPDISHYHKSVFLGDLVISTGLVQHDYGRVHEHGFETKRSSTNVMGQPPPAIGSFISLLQTVLQPEQLVVDADSDTSDLPEDCCYPPGYIHRHRAGCTECDQARSCSQAQRTDCQHLGCYHSLSRFRLPSMKPTIHFGNYGCGNGVLRSANFRDAVAAKYSLLAFEMEDVGVWQHFPCIIVKSVVDYCDSHKSKGWQKYGAAVAAAALVRILHYWAPTTNSTRNIKRIREEEDSEGLAKRSTRLKISSHPDTHWIVNHPVDALFTGRAALAMRIQETFTRHIQLGKSIQSCCVVVTGLIGQGKSALALQVAHMMRDRFWGVFWIDARTSLQADLGFANLARRFGRPNSDLEQAKQTLANEHRRWLLILDDAHDPTIDYSAYMPSGGRGCILLTSRNPACGRYATAFHATLSGLTDDEGLELLQKTIERHSGLTVGEPSSLRPISSMLHNHPLALRHAGMYMANGGCTPSQYVDVHSGNLQRSLHLVAADERSHKGTILATFEASLEEVAALFQGAWHANYDSVDGQDVQSHHDPQSLNQSMIPSPFLESSDALAVDFVQALRTFEEPAVSIHPLVRSWARHRQNTHQQRQAWVRAIRLLALVSLAVDHESIGTRSILQNHVLAALEPFMTQSRSPINGVTARKVAVCLYRLALLLSSWSLYSEAHHVLRSLTPLVVDGADSQSNDLKLSIRELHAFALRKTGKSDEAIAIQSDMIDALIQEHGPVSSMLLLPLHDLSRAYEGMGLHGEKEAALRHIDRLEEYESTGEAKASEPLLELRTLKALIWSGKHNEALPRLEDFVKRIISGSPTDVPKVTHCTAELIQAYVKTGRFTDALAVAEALAETVRTQLPDTHRARRLADNMLMLALWKNGFRERSLEVMNELVENARKAGRAKRYLTQRNRMQRAQEKLLSSSKPVEALNPARIKLARSHGTPSSNSGGTPFTMYGSNPRFSHMSSLSTTAGGVNPTSIAQWTRQPNSPGLLTDSTVASSLTKALTLARRDFPASSGERSDRHVETSFDYSDMFEQASPNISGNTSPTSNHSPRQIHSFDHSDREAWPMARVTTFLINKRFPPSWPEVFERYKIEGQTFLDLAKRGWYGPEFKVEGGRYLWNELASAQDSIFDTVDNEIHRLQSLVCKVAPKVAWGSHTAALDAGQGSQPASPASTASFETAWSDA